MTTETNVIPSINAAGRFEALAPFDKVVIPSTFYTVEALRTIHEMQALKLNLYDLVFAPIGVAETDYSVVLERARSQGAVVVSLTNRFGPTVYVLSTYFKSFPLIDGVAYERMCLVVDLGPCAPSTKDAMAQVQTHVQSYVKAVLGLDTTVKLGTVPTIGYVSAQDALLFENTRKNAITDGDNDVSKINALQTKLVQKDAYIAQLEAKLAALIPPPPPPVTP
jgi:hypothetical protein